MLVLGTSDSGFESRHPDIFIANMAFKKKVEDFVCEHCGTDNSGNGFTNHCYNCLWSKHVDVDPGDRQEECGGMMKPISVEGIVGKYDLVQKCEKCGFVRKNKVWPRDNFDEIIKIAKQKKP